MTDNGASTPEPQAPRPFSPPQEHLDIQRPCPVSPPLHLQTREGAGDVQWVSRKGENGA